MEFDFWHNKWNNNEIGFHEGQVNVLLERHIAELNLKQGDWVFLPLCGKAYDMIWLRNQGYSVLGAELSTLAVERFFVENGLDPVVKEMGQHRCYTANDIYIFAGDFLQLTQLQLEAAGIKHISAVYDRAAMVALPETMREDYSKQLRAITNTAQQLLIAFEYDQSVMPGPPFSIDRDEVEKHYQEHYEITLLERQDVPGGLKGKCPATESAYLLGQVL